MTRSEEIGNRIYDIARAVNIEDERFFKMLYDLVKLAQRPIRRKKRRKK